MMNQKTRKLDCRVKCGAGDIIPNDDLIEPPARTEAQKQVNKGMRYVVHNEAVLDVKDRHHVVEIKPKSSLAGFFDLNTDLAINEGFVNKNPGLRMSHQMGVTPMPSGPRPGRTKQVSSPV